MTDDILKSLEDLLGTLKQCRTQETDERTIGLYNIHIDITEKILSEIKPTKLDQTLIDHYFEQEGRNYGWSYLPNENGRIAEKAFWDLKKKLGYDKD